MFIIWLRKDGYVGVSAATTMSAFKERAVSPNPVFQIDRVLFTAENWDTDTVERLKAYRREFSHHLYQVEK